MLERDVSAALNETEARYRPLRVLGGLVLLVGLVCLSLATFVYLMGLAQNNDQRGSKRWPLEGWACMARPKA